MSPRVLMVVGARPNFVKVAPVWHALVAAGEVEPVLLHTGQHYDRALSGSFLEQLSLPSPAHSLGVGSGSHGQQTAAVLIGVEGILEREPADAILVAGDVNSTLGAALAAAKLGTPVIHLEAGLRSRDWTMPEEINRVLTDRLSRLLLCPSPDAADNLASEGIDPEGVAIVGNTMIDSLLRLLPAARDLDAVARLGLERRAFVLVTLHRPALVDDLPLLAATLEALGTIASTLPVVLPLHPRTRDRVGSSPVPAGVTLLDPLEYLEFLAVEEAARLVVTDSGGVQEETSFLGVPCLTYRTTTERPITTTAGTNRLIGLDPARLEAACWEALATPMPTDRPVIPLWDGAAAPRAAHAIAQLLAR